MAERIFRSRGGYFILEPGVAEIEIKNTVTLDGAMLFLKSLFQNVALTNTSYYMGLTNANYTFESATLASIAAGEPVGNGYARQAIARDTSNWTISVVNNMARARSATVQFDATSLWTVEWTRAFLCSVASGTTGTVFALSKAITPQSVPSGQGPALAYDFWERG